MTERGARTHIDTAAFHEAGHAVAALWEGRRVVEASVRRDLPGNGVVRTIMARRPNPFDAAASPGTAQAAWRHTLATRTADVRVLLAGPLAEAKALGQPLRSLASRSDFEKCQRLADELEALQVALMGFARLPRLDTAALLNEERARVRRWLGRPKVWYLVHRVAERLSRNGVVHGPDLLRELALVQRPRGQLPLDLCGPPRHGWPGGGSRRAAVRGAGLKIRCSGRPVVFRADDRRRAVRAGTMHHVAPPGIDRDMAGVTQGRTAACD